MPILEVCNTKRTTVRVAHGQGNHKEGESSVKQQKMSRLTEPDNNCDDRDQMWGKLVQLQKAIFVTEPEVDMEARNHLANHPETGTVSSTALKIFSSNQPRPTYWVRALHQEAKREALLLAYRNIGDVSHECKPRYNGACTVHTVHCTAFY